MNLHFPSMLSMALAFVCCTAPAMADPVTAIYRVNVLERMTWESNPIWHPFLQEFTLYMTFDPANAGDRTYGPVWFSTVPLPGVSPPAGLSLTTNRYTAHGRFDENPYGPLNLFASATQYEFGSNAEWTYFRNTRLITNVPTGDASLEFTAETFPAHLVLGPYNFDYGTSLFGHPAGSRPPETFDYRGLATLLEVTPTAPIPEPTTLALIGGALGIVACRRRARRAP